MNTPTPYKTQKASDTTPFVNDVVAIAKDQGVYEKQEAFLLFHIRQGDDGSAKVYTASNLKSEGMIKLLEDTLASLKMVN